MSSRGSEQTNTAFRAFGARTLAQANIGRRSGRRRATKGTKNRSHKGHKEHEAEGHKDVLLQNNSFDTFLHGRVVEIQEISEAQARGLQVRNHLRLVDFMQRR